MEKQTGWLFKPEAAEYLGISVTSLSRLIDKRMIPFYKPGCADARKKGVKVRFKKADLDKYLESGRVDAI